MIKNLGQKIRECREKKGLKQQDVANALLVSPQAVSKWERGENSPDISILAPLARFLGVSVDWLLSVNDQAVDLFEATVFISSIQGICQRSLSMDAKNFTTWANALFYQLTELTLRYEAVPIKYLGDRYLCFFAGTDHRFRASKAAFLCVQMIQENLNVGLSSGLVHVAAVGHPEYSRPDIMGETVYEAFLTLDWAMEKAPSGVAITGFQDSSDLLEFSVGAFDVVHYPIIDKPVAMAELIDVINKK